MCLEMRRSELWRAQSADAASAAKMRAVEEVMDRSISRYLSDAMNGQRTLPVLEEYSWLHDIAIGRLRDTADRLIRVANGSAKGRGQRGRTVPDLEEQKVSLSLAKLAVFADGDDDDDDQKVQRESDIASVQAQLLWINGRTLLRNVAPNTFDHRKLAAMSKRQVIDQLIRYSLTTAKALDYGKVEQLLTLIQNVEPLEEQQSLSGKSLIILLVENVIGCNERDWKALDETVPEKSRTMSPFVTQVLPRTVLHDITKYLYHRKRQSRFWEKNERRKRQQQQDGKLDFSTLFEEMEDDDDDDAEDASAADQDGGLWELWKSGLDYCIANQQTKSRYYYAARAFLHAQK